MEQYILKSVLVAEIEKIRAKWFGINNDFADGQKVALTDVLSLINTLEVKETDVLIEKACEWLSKHAKKYYFNKDGHYLGTDELIEDFKLSMEL